MKLPSTINLPTYWAYKPTTIIEQNRKVKAENFEWDCNCPANLANLCIEKLSQKWHGSPKLEEFPLKDRDFFIQILSTDVPLQILVDNINSDVFWKRSYYSRWNDPPIIGEERKWINAYMEHHYADILENMNPKDYDPEKINNLVKMCGPYIQTLAIRSLVPMDIPVQRMVSPEMANLITTHVQENLNQAKSIEPLTRDHISLHAVLGSLSHLTELHVTYQLKNIGVEYRKDQFQFTNNDAKNLGRALEKCSQIKILRITRSDMNCQRVKHVLRGLIDSKRLETLDFSHCKIGDEGASSIAKLISRHDNLRTLMLADNFIGPNGAESIAHALNHVSCGIRNLDLRLNNKMGSEGVAHVAVSVARGCNLTFLNLSGCGIKPGPLIKAPAGVWSAMSAENPPSCGDLLARAIGLAKTPLRSLDLSVNDIGSPSDFSVANAICLSYLIDVNLRRSGMSPKAMAIGECAAAAQRLRREAEKGIRFRRSAGRVLHARRVAKGMNIGASFDIPFTYTSDADPILIAQQLSARPSIVSVASEEGTYTVQTQPLPSDFGFVPAFKSPLPSSRTSSVTGPPTSRRSSHHIILDPLKERAVAPPHGNCMFCDILYHVYTIKKLTCPPPTPEAGYAHADIRSSTKCSSKTWFRRVFGPIPQC
ncbi:Dynein regulatory complex subunit 5 [Eumeta japonica]|uniref:Dynein regulatory complex subunit 5 n=1 Tax=Eumeta variegata TaxID=151549 RepID=A0A4C1YU44_EUMVA|nr:Dynein regulatory complex subunit 5 [Eumeta japonica]